MSRFFQNGFTLAELLVALLILGEIATFTIPKILTSQQNGQYKAGAKEAISMISAAYQQAQLNGVATTAMTPSALTQYMNYVSVHTADIDRYPTNAAQSCSTSGYSCIKLHSGGVLLLDWDNFGGSNATNAINFMYDPDGIYSGSTSGNSKSLAIFLYYNGRISTFANIATGTGASSGWPTNPCTACEPTWFSW